MTAREETELIRRIRLGDDDAFAQVYRATAPFIRNCISKITNNGPDVDDLLQEVYLQLYTKVDLFRGDSRLQTWLYRVATNLVYMRHRAGRSARAHTVELSEEDYELAVGRYGRPATQENSVIADELREIIADLPARRRQIVELHGLEEYSHQETAAITGTSIGNCKSQYSRALRRIGEAMSNRKKKQHRLRADKLNAARAREAIGTPRPGQTLPHRGGGSDASFKETDLGHYMHLSEPKEPTPQYAKASDITVRNPIRLQTRDYHPPAEVRQYSPEAIAHINYLHQKGEEHTMDQAQKTGGVELALEDAREKLRFYQRQMAEAEREHARWRQVVESLESTLALITGKAPIPVNGSGTATPTAFKPRGFWPNAIRELLKAGPISRNALTEYMIKQGASKGAAYQAIFKMEKDGKLKMTSNGFIWAGQVEESDFDSATEGTSA